MFLKKYKESSQNPSTVIHSAVLQETKPEYMLEDLGDVIPADSVTHMNSDLLDQQALAGTHSASDEHYVPIRETSRRSKGTRQLIKQLHKDCHVNTADIILVRTIMEDVMDKLCRSLSDKHPFFKGCTPILRGSMREQTKISAPDEIDFMICILDVKDYVTLDLEKTPGVVTKKTAAKDLTSAKVSGLIRESLEENLPCFWCLPPVNTVYHSIHNSLARSYLVRAGECMPVKDISVDITLVTKKEDSYVVLSRDWKHCLWTFPEHEIELSAKLGRNSEFIPCLKYAKYLAEHFFGHYEIRGKGYSVKKAYLPSFALKTILFYMLADTNDQDIKAYTESFGSGDQEEEQFNILHALFKRLAKALDNYELPNYFFANYDIFRMSKSFKRKIVLQKCEQLLGFLDSIKRGEKDSLSELYATLDIDEPRHFTQHDPQCLPRTRSGIRNEWSMQC